MNNSTYWWYVRTAKVALWLIDSYALGPGSGFCLLLYASPDDDDTALADQAQAGPLSWRTPTVRISGDDIIFSCLQVPGPPGARLTTYARGNTLACRCGRVGKQSLAQHTRDRLNSSACLGTTSPRADSGGMGATRTGLG
jgi:hypothetical protein